MSIIIYEYVNEISMYQVSIIIYEYANEISMFM